MPDELNCYGRYDAPELLTAALFHIGRKMERVHGGISQEELTSPFDNSGAEWSCDTFQVRAYDWSWDGPDSGVPKPWNFRWGDIEVYWYKYLGRAVETSRPIGPDEISVMLDNCIESCDRWEKLNNPALPAARPGAETEGATAMSDDDVYIVPLTRCEECDEYGVVDDDGICEACRRAREKLKETPQ
jgi:hypothetical protein